MYLVSAWAVERRISLGQLATEEKSNKITAIPELLDEIDIESSVVTIDAAGCQKSIAAKISRAKGDYVLVLKGNQSTSHTSVMNHVIEHMENDFADVDCRRHSEELQGHGRIDKITYFQSFVPGSLPGRQAWEGRSENHRGRNSFLANNLAWLKRLAISLLNQVDGKESIAIRRRMVSWNPTYLTKVLGIPT